MNKNGRNRDCLDIWDLTGVKRLFLYIKRLVIKLLLVTTFLKDLPIRKKEKKIQSWNKHQIKHIIFPFKTIISDGFEIAAIKGKES